MAYDFKELERQIKESETWLAGEFAGVRSGRAAPGLLDSVTVSAYGAAMPLTQVSNIAIEGPRTLRITAWDKAQIKEIEKAITKANLGVSVGADDQGVRVSFPELTGERRAALIKLAKDRLEDARIALRGARDEVWSDIQEQCREGVLSEDEKFRLKETMQKIVDAGNGRLEEMMQRKEKEIAE